MSSDLLPVPQFISIHAPAWGATLRMAVNLSAAGLISIHAPAWGATAHVKLAEKLEAISIHAPAWGATV